MKSVAKFCGAVAVFALSAGSALAAGCLPNSPCELPEPDTLVLVAIAVGGMAIALRSKRK